jgi:hypothetical protein
MNELWQNRDGEAPHPGRAQFRRAGVVGAGHGRVSQGGGSSVFPAGSMMQSMLLTGTLDAGTAEGAIHNTDPELNEINKTLSQIDPGHIFEELRQKKIGGQPIEVNIKSGKPKRSPRAAGETSSHVVREYRAGLPPWIDRTIFDVTIDVAAIRAKTRDKSKNFDEFDAAEVLYHELKAHVYFHYENWRDYGQALSEFEKQRGGHRDLAIL